MRSVPHPSADDSSDTSRGAPRSVARFGREPLITPDNPSYKWWMAGTVMLSAFLVVINSVTVNMALPQMMTVFGLDLDQVQWVITAYMIAGAVMVPTVGWLGNVLGNRNLFLLSMSIFIVNSVFCGLAWSGPSLLFFRTIQGLGGGPISPMAMVFLNQAFPDRQRGLAMGLYGLGISCGPVLGPVLGGYVTEYLNWRMVFYVNIPPGLIALLLAMLVLPTTREEIKRSLDVPGLIALAVFLVSLLIALSQGQRLGWDTPYIQRLFVIAGIALVGFILIELSREEALVDLRLFQNFAFTSVCLFMFVTAMTFWGTGFLQTFLLQRLLDYSPAQAGLMVLPGALGMASTTLIAGRLVDIVDRRYVVAGGLSMFILASYGFAFLTLERSMNWMIWMIVARYLTISFVFTPMNAVSLMVLPPDKVRMGSGLINLMQQGLGGTMGLAMMTTVLQRRAAYHGTILGQEQVQSSLLWSEVLAPAREMMLRAGDIGAMANIKAMALVQRRLGQEAAVAAYQDSFMLVVILCLAVLPLIFFLRRQQYG